LTGGVKLEHNDFTGFEVQPSIRGTYKPTPKQALWAAVSRAVRTPAASEGNDTLGILLGGPFFEPSQGGFFIPRLVGNADLESEVLLAYEVGYRIQSSSRTSVDVALFYNDYSDMVSIERIARFVPGFPVGTAEVPWENSLEGQTYGAEVALGVGITDRWRLTATYTLLMVDIDTPIGDLPRSSPCFLLMNSTAG
jgi:iron complex outermembrane receptor protein